MGTPRADQLQGSPLDQLTELAGRISYDSLGRGRSSQEYHQHIIESGHGCYDIETEVLTSNGWKFWPDVTQEDKLATLSTDDVIEYQHPTAIQAYHYRGDMYRVDAEGVDLLVTNNHRMFVCPTTTKEGRKMNNYLFVTAQDLGTRSHAYKKTGRWDCKEQSMPLAVASFLGFAIGDGNIEERSSSVRFRLRRPRKIAYLKIVLDSLGWKWSTSGEDRYSVSIPDEWRGAFSGIYTSDRKKQIPSDVLVRNPVHVLEALFGGLMMSDGYHGKTGDRYDTTSSRLAGQFQQLCLHLGLAANISWNHSRGNGSYGTKPLASVWVVRNHLKPVVNKYSGSGNRSFLVEDWDGDVFCATVPNGTLYVRRNGKAVWCGNSVQEHGNLTLESEPLRLVGIEAAALVFLNRPGLFVRIVHNQVSGRYRFRLTTNIRAAREWQRWHQEVPIPSTRVLARFYGDSIQRAFAEKAPLAMGLETLPDVGDYPLSVVVPETDDEVWFSFHFGDVSRGYSHEQVRHKFRTGVSQRSTRYVDESESPWIWHPLLTRQGPLDTRPGDLATITQILMDAQQCCRQAYQSVMELLQPVLRNMGADKQTALKQARGAARGVLGNALETQLIFSASLSEWKWMMTLRASRFADAEIRLAFCMVYNILASTLPERWRGYKHRACPDGIGREVYQDDSADLPQLIDEADLC
jgi:thymidylate synthase ThyX